jgi:hypothetical protein
MTGDFNSINAGMRGAKPSRSGNGREPGYFA